MRDRALTIGLIFLLLHGAGEPVARADQLAPRGSPDEARQRSDTVLPVRLERLEQWLRALERHVPGEEDDALAEVAAWSHTDLQGLWVDANALIQMMRNRKLDRISVQVEGQRGTTEIRYTATQLRRLTVLACGAAGVVVEPECVVRKAGKDLDADLLRLSAHARAARIAGDENYILRRGALLHADVEMLASPPMPTAPTAPLQSLASFPPGYLRSGGPPATARPAGPERIRMNVSDGLETDLGQSAIHWELARMLLDHVKPLSADRAMPGRDDMVRQWYRATAAWMQLHENYDVLHLDRARQLFPTDPDILFLTGSQHETYAKPAIQSAVRNAVLPTGFSLEVGSERAELRRAEEFFRRALAQKPDASETHLRLGRVLGRLGRHNNAAVELREAVAAIPGDDPQLLYYGELFLGAEEEALGRRDAARASYEHAAALYPRAQSPWIALSQLAWRSGDRAGALRAIQQVFALRPEAIEREDPWWTYHVAQARNAETLLEELRKPFLIAGPR